ncbi:uncharacterized protein B0H18DRAFT_1109814 [Fomitopsis serialis]|uniref:uncharacterized protein n=1 Tax=Fomitopsis serialis TaxID=139415 RepID=UPI0020083B62|nr:uncharacterized protein B0H18DRAFT_1109814 [Neoantrodia serialis]KAH9911745.1 hypothetical protein B0H18DRAFT_1109814 [Neoantrodia serialis]
MSNSAKGGTTSKTAKPVASPTTRGASERPNTRATASAPPMDLKTEREKVDSYDKAYKVLVSRALIPEETQPSVGALVEGLRFCAETSNQAQVREAIYAFASYAEAIRDNRPAAKVLDDIRPILIKLTERSEAEPGELDEDKAGRLEEMVDRQVQSTTELNGMLGRLTEEVRKIAASQKKLAKDLETVDGLRGDLQGALKETQEVLKAPPQVVHHEHVAPVNDGGVHMDGAGDDPRTRRPSSISSLPHMPRR